MTTSFTSTVRAVARTWSGHLAHYRAHRNDEHREALVAEALRFVGLHLENELTTSEYWSRVPLARRAAVLLYLVDRGVVARRIERDRVWYEAKPHAESWVVGQPVLAAYIVPTLELLAALHQFQARRFLRAAND